MDGFLSTWKQARATFGDGTPPDGSDFDQSDRLRGLQTDVRSAAPSSAWTGVAANSYADTNTRHANTLGDLAVLDQRLGSEVNRSAEVVAAGRRDLDAVRRWVHDAAATVPNTAAGQRLLWPVISKGVNDLQDILDRSRADLSAIAGRVRALGGEYDALDGPMGIMGGGDRDHPVPATTLDLDDVVRKAPGALGDPGYLELVPGSGVWVPDPTSRFYRPTPVEAPLDYYDIEYYPTPPGQPKTLGPNGYLELVPGSGAWVPDPKAPGYRPHPPEAPVDLAEIQLVDPRALVPNGYVELWPRAGVVMPDPGVGRPS